MGLLEKFEDSLDRMVSGAFAKAFKAEVQPVELAAALQRDDIGSLAPGARADITLLRPGPDTVLRDAEAIGETVIVPWTPMLALVDGVVHDPATIDVPLRAYVAADHEVDCTAPLL